MYSRICHATLLSLVEPDLANVTVPAVVKPPSFDTWVIKLSGV
nr:hypothetical protein [Nitrosopumilus oxyclinae]